MVQIQNVTYARGESGPFVKRIVIETDHGEIAEMLTAEDVSRLLREFGVEEMPIIQ